jgi:hypothetical protein
VGALIAASIEKAPSDLSSDAIENQQAQKDDLVSKQESLEGIARQISIVSRTTCGEGATEPPTKEQTIAAASTPLEASIEEVKSSLQSLGDLSEGMFVKIDALFNRFDTDGNGVLEDQEYTACIDALVAHMRSEFEKKLRSVIEEKCQKDEVDTVFLTMMRKNFKEDKMKHIVIGMTDPHGNGKITKAEALAGFRKVVEHFGEWK